MARGSAYLRPVRGLGAVRLGALGSGHSAGGGGFGLGGGDDASRSTLAASHPPPPSSARGGRMNSVDRRRGTFPPIRILPVINPLILGGAADNTAPTGAGL